MSSRSVLRFPLSRGSQLVIEPNRNASRLADGIRCPTLAKSLEPLPPCVAGHTVSWEPSGEDVTQTGSCRRP
jgi:hypothetical protein